MATSSPHGLDERGQQRGPRQCIPDAAATTYRAARAASISDTTLRRTSADTHDRVLAHQARASCAGGQLLDRRASRRRFRRAAPQPQQRDQEEHRGNPSLPRGGDGRSARQKGGEAAAAALCGVVVLDGECPHPERDACRSDDRGHDDAESRRQAAKKQQLGSHSHASSAASVRHRLAL